MRYRGGITHANSVSSSQNLYVFSSHICCTLSDKPCCVPCSLNNHSYESFSNRYAATKCTGFQSCASGEHFIAPWVMFLRRTASILLHGKKKNKPKSTQLSRKHLFSAANCSAASAASWLCKPLTFPIIVSVHPGSVSLRPSSHISSPLHLFTGCFPPRDEKQSTGGSS